MEFVRAESVMDAIARKCWEIGLIQNINYHDYLSACAAGTLLGVREIVLDKLIHFAPSSHECWYWMVNAQWFVQFRKRMIFHSNAKWNAIECYWIKHWSGFDTMMDTWQLQIIQIANLLTFFCCIVNGSESNLNWWAFVLSAFVPFQRKRNIENKAGNPFSIGIKLDNSQKNWLLQLKLNLNSNHFSIIYKRKLLRKGLLHYL